MTRRFRIVGVDETDPKSGAISIDSPVARALLGKRIDDEVVVAIGQTASTLRIVSIRYESPPP